MRSSIPLFLDDSGLLSSRFRRSHIAHYAPAVSLTRRSQYWLIINGPATGNLVIVADTGHSNAFSARIDQIV